MNTALPFREEPGWIGAFTRDHAPGAIANGTAIVKACHEPTDHHHEGAPGLVLGSIAAPPDMEPQWAHVRFYYFVEWADGPRIACGVMDYKIRPAP